MADFVLGDGALSGYCRRMSAVTVRIMYVQRGTAPGRIGRVRLSKTGRTVFYGDRELLSIGGRGVRGNYLDVETREEYWVSGPRRDGQDALVPGRVEIDDDVRDEYWRAIRERPEDAQLGSFRSVGARGNHATR